MKEIAVRVAGEEVAESLTKESCDYIEKKLGLDYAWPGNYRELEQCARNILIQGDYRPENLKRKDSDDATLPDLLESGETNRGGIASSLYHSRVFEDPQLRGDGSTRKVGPPDGEEVCR